MQQPQTIKSATKKAGKQLLMSFPIILGTVALISLATALIPKSFYSSIFTGNSIIDSLIGAIVGSISAGNPITSYIIGGEMIKQNVTMFAVTSFLVAWVTVGLIQLPAESMILGKKFSIIRNITAFILAIVVAIIVTAISTI